MTMAFHSYYPCPSCHKAFTERKNRDGHQRSCRAKRAEARRQRGLKYREGGLS